MKIHFVLCLLLALPAMAQPAGVGLKITIRDSTFGLTNQTTEYIQGDRRRSEYRNSSGSNFGPPIASIKRCDLGQMFELNLDDKQYESGLTPKFPSEAERKVTAAKYAASPKAEPTILVEGTTVDTGERKKIFGYDARHVITTTKHTRLNQARDVEQESADDGWYTDLSTALSCESWPKGGMAFLSAGTMGKPVDVPSFKLIGKPEYGFALLLKTTTRNAFVLPDGSRHDATSTSERDVTELYSGPLDPQLFEVPEDSRR